MERRPNAHTQIAQLRTYVERVRRGIAARVALVRAQHEQTKSGPASKHRDDRQ